MLHSRNASTLYISNVRSAIGRVVTE